jgi:2-oxo-4-hydroxy-4-carboxy-5-ureidoimidazoline decarboxylase
MSSALARWNGLRADEAAEEILPCCGSMAWAHAMAVLRPIEDEGVLLAASDEVWRNLPESDWMEAFRSHPRIGESRPTGASSTCPVDWSGQEQRRVGTATEDVKAELAEANRAYEERFHRIFIVCANGKSAPEILENLRGRLQNDETTELHEAAEQQRQIARLRLRKWLNS